MASKYVDFRTIKIIGGVFTVFILLSAILFPVFACGCKLADNYSATISNCKQASLGMIMYAADWDDYLPTSHSWVNKVAVYINRPTIFNVSLDAGNTPRKFAMNKGISGRFVPKLDSEHGVMLFDSISNSDSPVGGKVLLAKYPKRDRYIIGFIDGHVEGMRTNQLKDVLWNPAIKK